MDIAATKQKVIDLVMKMDIDNSAKGLDLYSSRVERQFEDLIILSERYIFQLHKMSRREYINNVLFPRLFENLDYYLKKNRKNLDNLFPIEENSKKALELNYYFSDLKRKEILRWIKDNNVSN